MDSVCDLAAELVSVADREVWADPGFDLDTQGAPGPAGAGVSMADSGHRGRCGFCGGDDVGADAVQQPVTDLGGDLPADMADEQRDRQAGDRVTLRLSGSNAISPTSAPAEDSASRQECFASLISVVEWIRRPTRSL